VGLPDAAVRESIRRVWAAIHNSGLHIPRAFAKEPMRQEIN